MFWLYNWWLYKLIEIPSVLKVPYYKKLTNLQTSLLDSSIFQWTSEQWWYCLTFSKILFWRLLFFQMLGWGGSFVSACLFWLCKQPISGLNNICLNSHIIPCNKMIIKYWISIKRTYCLHLGYFKWLFACTQLTPVQSSTSLLYSPPVVICVTLS